MLQQLRDDHLGMSAVYYVDVAWDETLRRHETRPQAAEFGIDEMREWYRAGDQLGFAGERIISQESTLDETVDLILREAFGRVSDGLQGRKPATTGDRALGG
jgi:hypothetical protein